MNILLVGGRYCQKELENLGHSVFSIGLSKSHDVYLECPLSVSELVSICQSHFFEPQALVYMDNGNLPIVLGLEDLEIPLVFYSIDTYCNPWHIPFTWAFDFCLVAQKDYMPLFECGTHFFPLFAIDNYMRAVQSEEEWLETRDIPLVFVGTMGHRNNLDRESFLKAVKKIHPLITMTGDYRPIFSRARIVLNQSAVSEVNFRVFESMAMGAPVLCDHAGNGVDELFSFGVDSLPCYPRNNAKQAAILAAHWLMKENEHKLYEIAKQGQILIKEKHSAEARANELIFILEELILSKAHEKRLAELAKRKRLLSTAFAIIFLEVKTADGKIESLYKDLFEKYRAESQKNS